MQTRDGEHCGDAYALVNFIPSRASRSTVGICRTGIREFSTPSAIETGVPFHAQSSMKNRTIFGFVFSDSAEFVSARDMAADTPHARKVVRTTVNLLKDMSCVLPSCLAETLDDVIQD